MEFIGSQGDTISMESDDIRPNKFGMDSMEDVNVWNVWFSEPFTGSPAQMDLFGNRREERYYGKLILWVWAY